MTLQLEYKNKEKKINKNGKLFFLHKLIACHNCKFKNTYEYKKTERAREKFIFLTQIILMKTFKEINELRPQL